MGTLEWKTMETLVPLRARCLLGRGIGCDVRVDSPKVSSEHASLHWSSGAWELRDLGSRNGTFVEGRKLAPGERVSLEVGSTFSLARSGATFELRDASPPAAAAQSKATGSFRVAEGGILALPTPAQPDAVLFAASDGTWHLEIDDDVRPAVDQEEINVGNDTFLLEIPAPEIETLQSEDGAPLLESVKFMFLVTPDEEEVETTVAIGGQKHKLPPRRYHYLLVTLARAWIADEGVASSVRGWVDRDELCKKLEMDVNKLNVEIYRARKQLSALGVQGAAGLVERRPGTHEIRIGVTEIEVVRG